MGPLFEFIWDAEICLSDLRPNIANDITLPATHLEHVWELSPDPDPSLKHKTNTGAQLEHE